MPIIFGGLSIFTLLIQVCDSFESARNHLCTSSLPLQNNLGDYLKILRNWKLRYRSKIRTCIKRRVLRAVAKNMMKKFMSTFKMNLVITIGSSLFAFFIGYNVKNFAGNGVEHEANRLFKDKRELKLSEEALHKSAMDQVSSQSIEKYFR